MLPKLLHMLLHLKKAKPHGESKSLTVNAKSHGKSQKPQKNLMVEAKGMTVVTPPPPPVLSFLSRWYSVCGVSNFIM